MTDQLFANPSEVSKPPKAFGEVPTGGNGRYHMPLLPGESGPRSGGEHVSGGVMRMTNLCGAAEDTRALSVWEQALGVVGLVLAPELLREAMALVDRAMREGVDFERIREYPWLKEALAGAPHDQKKLEASIMGRAKKIAGGSAAAERGTADHESWEVRAKSGDLSGSGRSRGQVIRAESLLAGAGLVRVPGLSERVVRNVRFGAVGKFDDILMESATGRLLIADLKTKARPFYSWMSVDAQLAGYACAEWMLTPDCQGYEPGPLHHVDQTEGVILHVPSDGSPAYLRRADLINGRKVLANAVETVKLRAYSKSAGRHAMSPWTPGETAEDRAARGLTPPGDVE